jgi:hypothetical protein
MGGTRAPFIRLCVNLDFGTGATAETINQAAASKEKAPKSQVTRDTPLREEHGLLDLFFPCESSDFPAI